jgi:hypothetical protein
MVQKIIPQDAIDGSKFWKRFEFNLSKSSNTITSQNSWELFYSRNLLLALWLIY